MKPVSYFSVEHWALGVGRSPERPSPRRGATLLVTLGILTVLSVLVVAFFTVSRIQRQTALLRQNRDATRNQLNEALHLAMRTVEDAFCHTNFTDAALSEGETDNNSPPPQRLAPVGTWFSAAWQNRKEISTKYAFQAPGLLVSPLLTSNDTLSVWTAKLLTPEVLALIPPSLTNTLTSTDDTPLRVGWQLINRPSLGQNGTRIAFAIFDVSGFIDANYFVSGPTTQKLPRVCFSQADVTNWLVFAESQGVLDSLTGIAETSSPETVPFSSLSYDPDPDADPFFPDSAEANPLLGYASFARSRLRKFDINSFTNWTESTEALPGNWTLSPDLMANWLRPVASALTRANANEPDDNPGRLTVLQTASLPWNILNFIDQDRVPQLSLFAGIDLATRHNAAIEDVPLINKVTVFDIGEAPDDPAINLNPQDYYGIDNYAAPDEYGEGKVSNHYAVAIELWYPFAPNSPPPSCAVYVGVYTNQSDVGEITFERPLNAGELQDWFLWNEAATSNTVMQTLFYAWADAYTNRVGSSIWQHPLWQTVTDQGDLWFTPAMTNHPSWPVADSNGYVSITSTPIWQAFYPDTYTSVSTNTSGTVTTNVYTYLNITNSYVEWVSDSGTTTNRLIGQIGVTDPDPMPVLLWENLSGSTHVTNVLGAFAVAGGITNLFVDTGLTNHLLSINSTPSGIEIVISNDISGTVTADIAEALELALWNTNALAFTYTTNIYTVIEITPVEPLPMPEDLGATLDALFGILLAPELGIDTSEELYDFLMRLPSEFDWWDFLVGYLAQYPLIQSTIIPSYREPTLGNLTDEDRMPLTEAGDWKSEGLPLEEIKDSSGKIVGRIIKPSENPSKGFGTYWVIYPRNTVSFREITTITPDETGTGDTAETQEVISTNYCAIGTLPGQTGPLTGEGPANNEAYRVFLRPVITIIPRVEDQPEHDAPDSENRRSYNDRIVDEALLDGSSVRGWNAVTNIYVADPRHNAYADYWLPNALYPIDSALSSGRPPVLPFNDWTDPVFGVGTTNLSTEVTEYPFIHLNTPLSSIGDIGHMYTSPDRLNLTRIDNITTPWQGNGTRPLYDTVSFSSRPGAALLDLFTVHATPSNLPPWQTGVPWRGLVQANTQHRTVIETLFSNVTVGWTNNLDSTDNYPAHILDCIALEDLSELYLDSLVKTPPEGIGWRSYADMLPSIATNESMKSVFSAPFSDAPSHDWIEDALRRIPDKVSFRQNIFVIVIAAQTLSPASTDKRPVVLADQRAAVTVIRDAYTGRWAIHSWIWLTE